MAFEIPPYNHCDYRCERCDKKDKCTVYKSDRKQQLEHILKGEDPYDMKIVLEDVGKSFEEATTMIRKMAEREGIDLDAAMAEYDPKEEKRREERLRRHPFYTTAEKFFDQAHNFLKIAKEKVFISPEIQEHFDELTYYHTLILPKTYRALSMYDRSDVEVEDSVNNTELIIKVIGTCRNSLENILYYRPQIKSETARLLKTLNALDKHAKKFLIRCNHS